MDIQKITKNKLFTSVSACGKILRYEILAYTQYTDTPSHTWYRAIRE